MKERVLDFHKEKGINTAGIREENRSKRSFFTIIIKLLLVAAFFVAEVSYGATKPLSTAEQASTGINSDKEVRVISLRIIPENGAISKKILIDDRIVLKVKNAALLKSELEMKRKKPILFLAGLPMKGVYGHFISADELLFHLTINDDSKATWFALIGQPQQFTKKLSVGIGIENEYSYPTDLDGDSKIEFIVINKARFIGWLLFIVATLLLLVLLGSNSTLLRSFGPKSPFSLSLVQMTFWLYIVVNSFLFIFIVTRATPQMNAQLFMLMGITTFTTFGANVIGKNKAKNAQAKLEAEKEDAEKKLEAIGIDTEGGVKLKASIEKMSADIQAIVNRPKTAKSKGFLEDLISDANGISLHRFQILVWTVILGAVFIAGVYKDLSMPEFEASLLGLMGISSGTYLGFKLPESLV